MHLCWFAEEVIYIYIVFCSEASDDRAFKNLKTTTTTKHVFMLLKE